MSIAKKVAFNTIIQFAGKIVSLTLGLASIGLLTRYLGVEEFGFYTTITTFLSVFGVLADFGLVLVSAQLLTTHAADEAKIFGTLLSIRLLSAFIFIGVAPLLVWFFPYPHAVKIGVALNATAFIAIAVQQICTGLFQKYLAMKYLVIAEFVGRCALLISIGVVIAIKGSFLQLIIAITSAQLVQIIISLAYASKFTALAFRFDTHYAKKILQYAWPIGLGILFNTIYLRGDALILSLTRTQTEVGLYGAAYRILDIITQVPIMFMGVMLPIISKTWAARDIPSFTRILQRTLEFMIIIAGPIIAGAIILSKPIMDLIGGPDFAAAAPIAATLSFALLGGFLGAMFGHINVAINRQKQALWVYALVAVIALVSYIVTIPRFGVYGAAGTSVLAETLAGLLLYFTVIKHTNIRLHFKFFFLKVAAATTIMGTIVHFTEFLPLAPRVILGMIIYGALILAFNIISKDDMQAVLRKS